jgi:hypothetical protein
LVIVIREIPKVNQTQVYAGDPSEGRRRLSSDALLVTWPNSRLS